METWKSNERGNFKGKSEQGRQGVGNWKVVSLGWKGFNIFASLIRQKICPVANI